MAEIPRILHQIWLGPARPPRKLLESVRAKHPHWDYRLWTDANLPPMRNRDAFDRSIPWHQKADILRYELLWQFGGVYVDADSYALRPLDDLLAGEKMFAGYERGVAGMIANGVIGCAPEHPVMDRVIRELNVDGAGPPWAVTGPLFFTRVIEREQASVCVHPSHFFYPFHHSDRLWLYFRWHRFNPRLRHSYFIQYWGTTTGYYEAFVTRWRLRVRYELVKRGWRQ